LLAVIDTPEIISPGQLVSVPLSVGAADVQIDTALCSTNAAVLGFDQIGVDAVHHQADTVVDGRVLGEVKVVARIGWLLVRHNMGGRFDCALDVRVGRLLAVDHPCS
jgi:hypothetical protein